MKNVIISDHARLEIERRKISEMLVHEVMKVPQQVLLAKKGRKVYQSKFIDPLLSKEMLLRVIATESVITFKL